MVVLCPCFSGSFVDMPKLSLARDIHFQSRKPALLERGWQESSHVCRRKVRNSTNTLERWPTVLETLVGRESSENLSLPDIFLCNPIYNFRPPNSYLNLYDQILIEDGETKFKKVLTLFFSFLLVVGLLLLQFPKFLSWDLCFLVFMYAWISIMGFCLEVNRTSSSINFSDYFFFNIWIVYFSKFVVIVCANRSCWFWLEQITGSTSLYAYDIVGWWRELNRACWFKQKGLLFHFSFSQ